MRVFVLERSDAVLGQIVAALVTHDAIQVVGVSRSAVHATMHMPRACPDVVVLSFEHSDGLEQALLLSLRHLEPRPMAVVVAPGPVENARPRYRDFGADVVLDRVAVLGHLAGLAPLLLEEWRLSTRLTRPHGSGALAKWLAS